MIIKKKKQMIWQIVDIFLLYDMSIFLDLKIIKESNQAHYEACFEEIK